MIVKDMSAILKSVKILTDWSSTVAWKPLECVAACSGWITEWTTAASEALSRQFMIECSQKLDLSFSFVLFFSLAFLSTVDQLRRLVSELLRCRMLVYFRADHSCMVSVIPDVLPISDNSACLIIPISKCRFILGLVIPDADRSMRLIPDSSTCT